MAIPTRAEVDQMIRERLASDPDFRGAMLADPRGTLSALVGIELPEAIDVEVHEESLTHLHITLPAADLAGAELSDDSLEMVAGGACWSNCGDYGP